MLNKNETFSLTLLFRNSNEKLLLISQSEEAPKSEQEAETVLDSKVPEDAEIIETLIEKIPLFKEANDLAEEETEISITRTLLELENDYGISLADGLEGAGLDLEDETSEQHFEDSFENEKQADGAYSLDVLNDPTAILPEGFYIYTNPVDFLNETGIEDEYTYPTDYSLEEYKDLGICTADGCTKKASVLAKVNGKEKAFCDDCYKEARKNDPKNVRIAEGFVEPDIQAACNLFLSKLEANKPYDALGLYKVFKELTILSQTHRQRILEKIVSDGRGIVQQQKDRVVFIPRTDENVGVNSQYADPNLIRELVDPNYNFSGNIKGFKPGKCLA